ncbi:hypothetical protein AWB65_05893 [Caballeronia humi]|uniref:Uncharacterized protein n=1 Tax=Caballeronia humi TaxID=326474 RepID=A0A158J534_9BURK|nr:hypothetical protein AWB65_05893 [Caballeronia humi]
MRRIPIKSAIEHQKHLTSPIETASKGALGDAMHVARYVPPTTSQMIVRKLRLPHVRFFPLVIRFATLALAE